MTSDLISTKDFGRIAYFIDNYIFPFDISGARCLDVGGADGSHAIYLKAARNARVDILDEYEGHGSSASNYPQPRK